MVQLGLNRSKLVQMGPKWGFKIGVQNYYELNRMAFKPRYPGSCFNDQSIENARTNSKSGQTCWIKYLETFETNIEISKIV